MRFNCASKASSDLPKATNTSPARVASAQGIERRSTKASGEKLSCVVRFTCAEGGALPSSLLSLLRLRGAVEAHGRRRRRHGRRAVYVYAPGDGRLPLVPAGEGTA